MSDTVEIYICKEGQALQQRQVAYADDIDNKMHAEKDAIERCRGKAWIQKLAYYKINGEGDFRIIFTYTNPDFESGSGPRKTVGRLQASAKGKKRTAKPTTFNRKSTKPRAKKLKQKPKGLMQKISGVFR